MFRRPEALAVCPPGGDPRERGMFLNQTANYGLSQWEATDRILMEDFNSDNSKIDAALGTLAQTVTGHTTALAQKGNCQLYMDSYTGTGTYGTSNPTSITFPVVPALAIIIDSHALAFVLGNSGGSLLITGGGGHDPSVSGLGASWSGSTLSYYSTSNARLQLNENGTVYFVYAFCAEE